MCVCVCVCVCDGHSNAVKFETFLFRFFVPRFCFLYPADMLNQQRLHAEFLLLL